MKLISKATVLIFLITSLLMLSGCGFQLRGDYALDDRLGKTWLQTVDEYSFFSRSLTRSLERSGVELVSSPELADSIIELSKVAYNREVLSIGNDARVREFRIQLEVEFQVLDGQLNQPEPAENEEVQPRLASQILRQQRDLRFDAGRVLATSREEEFMREDMSTTMVRLLMQRLGQLEEIK